MLLNASEFNPQSVGFLGTVRYMPGLAEGLEGVKAGEKREIQVTFPDKLGPQGGDLEGVTAIFEVEAVEIKVRCPPKGIVCHVVW